MSSASVEPRAARPAGGKVTHLRDSLRQVVGLGLVALLTWAGEAEVVSWSVGSVLVVCGVAVRLWASGCIKKNKELATFGPYAYVRHPLYVGNLLIALGFCLASNLWWSYPMMLLFWLVFYPTAIRDEDRKLHHIFGERWEAWRAETRALVPRMRPHSGEAKGRWSFHNSLRLNGEPIVAVLLLACLVGLYANRI